MWISQRPVVINNQTADEQLTDKVENLDKWIAILPDIRKTVYSIQNICRTKKNNEQNEK